MPDALCHTPTSRSGSGYGRLFSSTASITLEIAVFVPIAIASVRTVTAVNMGARPSRRAPSRNRAARVSILGIRSSAAFVPFESHSCGASGAAKAVQARVKVLAPDGQMLLNVPAVLNFLFADDPPIQPTARTLDSNWAAVVADLVQRIKAASRASLSAFMDTVAIPTDDRENAGLAPAPSGSAGAITAIPRALAMPQFQRFGIARR